MLLYDVLFVIFCHDWLNFSFRPLDLACYAGIIREEFLLKTVGRQDCILSVTGSGGKVKLKVKLISAWKNEKKKRFVSLFRPWSVWTSWKIDRVCPNFSQYKWKHLVLFTQLRSSTAETETDPTPRTKYNIFSDWCLFQKHFLLSEYSTFRFR